MADLGVLAQIPGLAGYLQTKRMNEAQSAQGLQGVAGGMGILAQIQAQQKAQKEAAQQEQFRTEIATAKTPEEQLAISTKYITNPKDLATLIQTAQTKKEQSDQTKQLAMQRLSQQAQRDLQGISERASRAQTAQERFHWQQQMDVARNYFNNQAAEIAAGRYNYDTGGYVPKLPSETVMPTPSVATQPQTPVKGQEVLMAGGKPIPAAEVPAARAAMAMNDAGMPVSIPGLPSGSGALAQINERINPPIVQPTQPVDYGNEARRSGTQPASTVVQPTQQGSAEKPVPEMPPEIAKLPKRAQDAWRVAQSKKDINLAGGRESVFINRVVLSGNQAAADLANVAKLPLTSSSRGMFGGRGQDTGIFNAGKETLATALTSQEVATYNVLATGFQRALAAIESAGLAPSGALMHQMDAVIFKEGDTNFTKLLKLAQTRQIVDKGLETIVSNDRVPAETKNHVKEIMEKMKKSVPFTPSDLIELQQRQAINPNATLGDVIGIDKSAPNKPSAKDFFRG